MKKGFFAVLLSLWLIIPNTVQAMEWHQQQTNQNKLHVEGKCGNDQVTIFLYPKEGNPKQEEIYSAGIKCENGKFSFEDDLSRWNIPNDSYRLVVGDKPNQPDFSKTEQFEVTNNSLAQVLSQEASSDANLSPEQKQFKNDKDNFSISLKTLIDALEQLKSSFENTSYHPAVKEVLSSGLGLVEKGVKLTQSFFEIFNNQVADVNNSPKTSAETASPSASLALPSQDSTSSATLTPEEASKSASEDKKQPPKGEKI